MGRLPVEATQRVIGQLLDAHAGLSVPDRRRLQSLSQLFAGGGDLLPMSTALQELFPEHEEERTAQDRFRQFKYRLNHRYLKDRSVQLQSTPSKEPLRFKMVWFAVEGTATLAVSQPARPAADGGPNIERLRALRSEIGDQPRFRHADHLALTEEQIARYRVELEMTPGLFSRGYLHTPTLVSELLSRRSDEG